MEGEEAGRRDRKRWGKTKSKAVFEKAAMKMEIFFSPENI